MIASFSRALTEGLTKQMSDAEFDKALAKSIEEIYQASRTKIPAISPHPFGLRALPPERDGERFFEWASLACGLLTQTGSALRLFCARPGKRANSIPTGRRTNRTQPAVVFGAGLGVNYSSTAISGCNL